MMLNLQNVPGLFRRSNGQQESNVSGLLDPNIGNQALQITQRFTFPHRADRDILHGPPKIMLGCFVEGRSEEHTSELQSLMRISYAVFCLKKTKYDNHRNPLPIHHTQSHNTTRHSIKTLYYTSHN